MKILNYEKIDESRTNGLVLIGESSLNRILTKHYENGFIIITSYRDKSEKTDEQNKKDFALLKSIVANNDFSYIPVYGGYIENRGTENETEVREPALLITNYKSGEFTPYADDSKIYKLGLELAKKFNQDSFLFKPRGKDENPYYVTKDGQVDGEPFTGLSINNLVQNYFTDLSKKWSSDGKTSKRFTFTEKLYINENPSSFGEAKKRYGELFFNIKNL